MAQEEGKKVNRKKELEPKSVYIEEIEAAPLQVDDQSLSDDLSDRWDKIEIRRRESTSEKGGADRRAMPDIDVDALTEFVGPPAPVLSGRDQLEQALRGAFGEEEDKEAFMESQIRRALEKLAQGLAQEDPK